MKQHFAVCIVLMILVLGVREGSAQGLPAYKELKNNIDLAPRMLDVYEQQVKSCKKQFMQLQSVVNFSKDEDLIRGQAIVVEICWQKIQTTLAYLGKVAIGIHQVNQVPSAAAESGWTQPQLQESFQWNEITSEIMERLRSIQRKHPWLNEVDTLVEKARDIKNTRQVLYTGRFFIYLQLLSS